MTVHQIRLHGPWEIRPLESAKAAGRSEPDPASDEIDTAGFRKIDFPTGWIEWCDQFWDSNQTNHSILLERCFGCPGGLTEEQDVLLVLELENCAAEVWLNQNLLGQIQLTDLKIGFPIRSVLLARNRLRLLVNLSSTSPLTRFKTVRLEIDGRNED